MALPDIPPELRKLIAKVKAKRPRTVLEHILRYGAVTTDELATLYGYDHAPRAARDVKEQGIPLKMEMVVKEGRRMASYSLDLSTEAISKAGRRAFPPKLKRVLLERDGGHCVLCRAAFDEKVLQIDHRVPYEVAGDPGDMDPKHFVLVCRSCNRAKSWSCEHCDNWVNKKDPQACGLCFWVSPEDYVHVAEKPVRTLMLTWTGKEVADSERLKVEAAKRRMDVAALAKQKLRRF